MKPTIDSICPKYGATVTITRLMTRAERIQEGKKAMLELIVKNFFQGDFVNFNYNSLRFRVNLINSNFEIHRANWKLENISVTPDCKKFKEFLIRFDITTLLKIYKLLQKNHLDTHALSLQKSNYSFDDLYSTL